jgi:alkaline phosphatase D
VVGAPPAPDPTRTLLGDDQAAWLEDQLKTSTARWKLVGQQVMVANLILDKGKQLANLDQWQGYPESRTRLLSFLRDSGVKDVVILTGDIHSSWANELVIDPNDPDQYDPATGKGSLAVELVTPAISSPGFPDLFLGLLEQARPLNPHVRFVEPSHRGFVILDVTPERVQGAWYLFDDIALPEPIAPRFSAAWSVKAGETRLVAEQAPAPPRDGAPPAAP